MTQEYLLSFSNYTFIFLQRDIMKNAYDNNAYLELAANLMKNGLLRNIQELRELPHAVFN